MVRESDDFQKVIVPYSFSLFQLEKVSSQKRLHEIAHQPGAIRAGSTVDPQQRVQDYRGERYSGTMYYTQTQNMHSAETRLLQQHKGVHNKQSVSNASNKPGSVYVVKGKKFS